MGILYTANGWQFRHAGIKGNYLFNNKTGLKTAYFLVKNNVNGNPSPLPLSGESL
jgi:hypothetical protein